MDITRRSVLAAIVAVPALAVAVKNGQGEPHHLSPGSDKSYYVLIRYPDAWRSEPGKVQNRVEEIAKRRNWSRWIAVSSIALRGERIDYEVLARDGIISAGTYGWNRRAGLFHSEEVRV